MIVVTGAAGQLGRAATDLLLDRGVEVHACDLVEPPVGTSRERVDLADLPEGFRFPAAARCVLHLAGSREDVPFTTASASALLQANLLATAGALAACPDGVERFVHVSSLSVYDASVDGPLDEETVLRPPTPYGASKLSAELAVRLAAATAPSRRFVLLRLAQVYGPGTAPENAVSRLIDQAVRDRTLSLTCSSQLARDYLHVDDAVAALAVACDAPCGTFNVGAGRAQGMPGHRFGR